MIIRYIIKIRYFPSFLKKSLLFVIFVTQNVTGNENFVTFAM